MASGNAAERGMSDLQIPARNVDRPVLAPESPVPILLVDDNATKRLALKSVLAPLGYSIVEADSGVAALRCVTIQEFAVILLDVRMPIMSGVETATLIRQRRQSEMTPIIFITAHGSDEIMHTDRYAQGAVDFIFAPVEPDELRAKVSVFANLFKRAEALAARAQELQTSADQLRLLTEAAPIGIFQTDGEHRYVYTNPRWSEITGIPPEEAAGQDWGAIVGAETRAGSIAELPNGELYRGELSHRFEIQVPGAPTRIVLVTSKSIPGSGGGSAGWVGTLADITAEAGAEAAMSAARDEANEASRLKSDFLANMSHEIRTPMNGVIGMTDLLLETELDTRQRDYAQTVRNSGEALLTIIDAILDFSKVEAGSLEIEHVEFSLRTVVDDVVDLLAGSAQAKGLELVTVVESSVPALATGDPGRVRQVVTNLIGNALKFTETGEVVLRVTLAETDGTDAVIRFDVSDTGNGIEPDKLESIFQPFVQADTSISRKYGGTGLGLAISAQLVALMGGDCGVTSRPSEGSNFWFTIRVRAAAESIGGTTQPSDARLAGVSALIVDDNATLRHILSEKMAEWGMVVTTAESGDAALATLRTAVSEGRPFAVALLDRSMPGMDGLQLKDAIAADPALDPRVVLMTNLGQDETAGSSTDSGVRATLSKPIHREALRACLHVALGLESVTVTPRRPTARRPALGGRPEAGRLLLAEDNLVNQEVAVAMLTNAGYRVDTVLNGAAAVRAVAAQSYDAILMDCQMPELNGYQATAAIRALEGPDRHTPIIAMTAGARREDRERCLAEGMDSYLAKPVSKDALLALVATSIRDGAHGASPPDRTRSVSPAPVLDRQVVDRLERLGEATGEDLMGQLTDLFLADADVRVAALRDALAANDATGASEAAHTLSGAAGNLGATDLAGLCTTMATNGASGELAEGKALLTAIEAELVRVRSALESPALAA
jgi:two-component system, sensor histidine kinase and response regulator